MAELKTKRTKASVNTFLSTIKDEQVRVDCLKIAALMQKATGAEPAMWGPGIIGFGSYHYKYASGREGDWMLTGLSPRKANLTVYIMAGFAEYEELLAKLGKHSRGKSCLYIKRLSDVHVPTLRLLIQKSVNHLKRGGLPNYT